MIDVIYEDNHLIACVKPNDIPVQEDSSGDLDMLTLLKEYIRGKYNKPGNVFVGLVHRLDRPVGGVMVFARTSKGASRLSDLIRKHEFEKCYLAVVHGRPKESDIFHDYLYKDTVKNRVFVVNKDHQESKEAILSYKLVDFKDGLSLVKIKLVTGRPHQIRVQFSSRGFPLYGDKRYGTDDSGENISLWSFSISFRHPTREELMHFEKLPPCDYPWNIFDFSSL